MKRIFSLLILAIFLGVLVGPFLYTIIDRLPTDTPDTLLRHIEEEGLGPAEQVGNLLYLNNRGQYIQFFPQLPQEGIVEAGAYEYDVTSADGYVWKSDTTYSAAHDSATGTVTDASGSIRIGQNRVAADDIRVYRGGLFFNTSAIPDDAIISYADIMLELGGDYSDVDFYACIVDGDDLGTGLIATDYAVLGNSDAIRATFDSADWAGIEGSYIPFVLSAGGISDISLNGTTAFGLRSYWDIVESTPIGPQYYTIRPTENSTDLGWSAYPSWLQDWECIDEASPNDNTDYIGICSKGDTGWLQFDNPVINDGDGDPLSVTVKTWACEVGGIAGKFKGIISTHSTEYTTGAWWECLEWNYYQVYTFNSYTWVTNPFTSAQWTWDEVGALALQLEHFNVIGCCQRVTQVYIDIAYIPTGAGSEYVDFSSYEMGVSQMPYLTVVYTIGNIPGAPTDLLCNGYEYPITDDIGPLFTAKAHHEDPGVTIDYYSIQIDDNVDFTSPMWSSGQEALSVNILDSERCEEIVYLGLPMTLNTRYYWRIKFYDEDTDEGPWSTTSYFDFSTPTDCPTNLVANPSSGNAILLKWDEATNFESTGVYWHYTSSPTSRGDGEQVCLTTSASCEHRGLMSGTNYYYSAWGYNPSTGNWSDCYISDWTTTLAGEDDDPSAPDVPPEWEQDPTCDIYSGISFVYDPLIGACVSFGMPEGTGCLLFTVGLIMFSGIVSYVASRRSEMVMLIVIAVGILIASIGGAMPMWMIAIDLPLGAAILYIWRRA